MLSIRDVSLQAPPARLPKRLSGEQIAAFERDGFLFMPALFTAEEIALLRTLVLNDPAIQKNTVGVIDSSGQPAELFGWGGAPDDLLGAFVRISRLVECAEDLLGGRRVYHWHSKLSFKRPRSAGRWDWHQDYGSWYKEGCLRPDMLSAMVAVDPCARDNGCVELLRGSNRLGRIEHVPLGPSRGADPEVVAQALENLDVVACEMDPGDVVFFHANTLHASGPNPSERPRTVLHVSYNSETNQPTKPLMVHGYQPLRKLPDEALASGDFGLRLDREALAARLEMRKRQKIGAFYGYQTDHDASQA